MSPQEPSSSPPDRGGYRYCCCRDCGEVTMTTGLPEHDWCSGCREAGCQEDSDCQAPHAYCEADSRASEDVYACSIGGKLASPLFRGDDAREQALAYGQENLATRDAGKASACPWGLAQFCAVCGQEF